MNVAVTTVEFVSATDARTAIIGYVPFNPMVVGSTPTGPPKCRSQIRIPPSIADDDVSDRQFGPN